MSKTSEAMKVSFYRCSNMHCCGRFRSGVFAMPVGMKRGSVCPNCGAEFGRSFMGVRALGCGQEVARLCVTTGVWLGMVGPGGDLPERFHEDFVGPFRPWWRDPGGADELRKMRLKHYEMFELVYLEPPRFALESVFDDEGIER